VIALELQPDLRRLSRDDPRVPMLSPAGRRRRVVYRMRAGSDPQRNARLVAERLTVGLAINISLGRDDCVRCSQWHLVSAAGHMDAVAAQSEQPDQRRTADLPQHRSAAPDMRDRPGGVPQPT